MLDVQLDSPEVLRVIGWLVLIVGTLFTIAIMLEGKSSKQKKRHNIFDEKDIFN